MDSDGLIRPHLDSSGNIFHKLVLSGLFQTQLISHGQKCTYNFQNDFGQLFLPLVLKSFLDSAGLIWTWLISPWISFITLCSTYFYYSASWETYVSKSLMDSTGLIWTRQLSGLYCTCVFLIFFIPLVVKFLKCLLSITCILTSQNIISTKYI